MLSRIPFVAMITGLLHLAVSMFRPSTALAVISTQTLRASSSASYIFMENAILSSELAGLSWRSSEALLTLQVNSVDSPLIQKNAAAKSWDVIDRITSADLSIAYRASERLLFAADVGANYVNFANNTSQFGFSDARVLAKYRLFSTKAKTGIALIPELYLPTGSKAAYLSNDSLGRGGLVAIEQQFPKFRLVANVGYRSFPNAVLRNVDYSEQIPLGLGGQLAFGSKFALNLEGIVSLLTQNNFKAGPGDLYFGAQYNVFRGGLFYLGVGIGNLSDSASPSYRVVAGIKVFPLRVGEEDAVTKPAKPTERIVKTILACGVKPFTVRFHARPLKKKEMIELPELPYRSTDAHAMRTLQIGQMTGLSQKGLPYVLDSQVLFAIDIVALPARSALTAVEEVSLRIDVQKVSKRSHNDSEVLCFLGDQVCSGELFEDVERKQNINPAFFHGKETPNDYFVTQYLKNEVGSVGDYKIYASQLSLELKSLLQNSMRPDPLNILYGDEDAANPLKKRTLYFAVSGNTFVGNKTYLDIVFKHNTCESLSERPGSAKKRKRAR